MDECLITTTPFKNIGPIGFCRDFLYAYYSICSRTKAYDKININVFDYASQSFPGSWHYG